MSNATVAQIGQINGSGALDALYLKLFGGEVITSFNTATVMQDKQMIREISNGKSAQFPATGKLVAGYHTPGTEILGQDVKQNERVIVIDDVLVSSVFFADIEEAKNHYDVRAPLTEQLGDALAQAFDTNSMQVAVLAARAGATISGQVGGSQITSASARTDATALSAAFFAAAQKLDEANVPDVSRYAMLKPAQYYLAASTKDLINKDWGGAGSISTGKFESLAGITAVKTNNLPQGNVVTGPSAYQGNFTNTAFLVFQQGAIGTVRLLNLSLATEYQLSKLGTLMVAKYAVGHGILRPHCAVEVKVS